MFKPRYKYTDKIIASLTKIAAAREVILNSPLIPRWEVSLRKDAIIRSAHSSTSIEGNNLSLEQVSELAAGRKIMAKSKDKEEVLNYINVLEKLDNLSPEGIITYETIKNIHVEYMNKNGKIAINEIAAMFKISRQASLKEIGKLVDLDVVKREGQARASYYIMR